MGCNHCRVIIWLTEWYERSKEVRREIGVKQKGSNLNKCFSVSNAVRG